MYRITNLFIFSPLRVALVELFKAIAEVSLSKNEIIGIIPRSTKVSLEQATEMLRLPKLRLKDFGIFLSSSAEKSGQVHSSAKLIKKN